MSMASGMDKAIWVLGSAAALVRGGGVGREG